MSGVKKVRKDTGGRKAIKVVRSAGRPVKPEVGDSVDTADRVRARVLKVNKVTSLCEFVRDNRQFRVAHEHLVLMRELPKGRRLFWAPNSSKLLSSAPVVEEAPEVAAEAVAEAAVDVAEQAAS